MEKTFVKNGTAVIFDDHKIFSTAFAMLLERSGLFAKVYTFSTEEQVIDFFVRNLISHVCLFMDYFIPNCNTIYIMNDIRRFCPSIQIVMVSSLTNPSLIKKLSLSNINGFISKTDGADEVLACLRALPTKEVFYSNKIKDILNAKDDEKAIFDLTPRELEILTLLSWSKTVEQISEQLNLSKHTVITHRRNLLTKSGCNSVTELVAYALRAGLIANA